MLQFNTLTNAFLLFEIIVINISNKSLLVSLYVNVLKVLINSHIRWCSEVGGNSMHLVGVRRVGMKLDCCHFTLRVHIV